MTEEGLKTLNKLNNEFDMQLTDDDIQAFEYLLYLIPDDCNEEDISEDDIIGFSRTPFIAAGDQFINPYDKSSYFEVYKVDESTGEAMVLLRKI